MRRGDYSQPLLMAGCMAVPHSAALADITINGSGCSPRASRPMRRGNIYTGSTGGTIYRALAGGTTADPWIVPSAENGLTSLFGVLADDNRELLWVCNNAPFGGPPKPGAKSGVKSFDLVTGELTGSYDFPGDGPAACNDITILGVADLYISGHPAAGGSSISRPARRSSTCSPRTPSWSGSTGSRSRTTG